MNLVLALVNSLEPVLCSLDYHSPLFFAEAARPKNSLDNVKSQWNSPEFDAAGPPHVGFDADNPVLGQPGYVFHGEEQLAG